MEDFVSRLRLAPALLTIVTAGTLALTSCASSGGDSGGAGGGGNSSSNGSSSGAPQSPAAALVPASIKSKGALTIAFDASYAPDESIDKDGKTIIGFDADLAKA